MVVNWERSVVSGSGAEGGSHFGRELLACAVRGTDPGEHPVRHIEDLPPRRGDTRDWPGWADPDLIAAFAERGVHAPWSHQAAAAELAHAGRHVVLSTGTASGKSLGYQLPILTALAADPRARALYLSPTKALGNDQLRTAHELTAAVPGLRDVAPCAYDGDAGTDLRRFARERSRWIFSNPDMIHLSLLRNHARWAVFLRNLKFIVVDECHYYRGIFGSNVALVLRRLLRLCERYSGSPTAIFASATTAAPAETASRLIGQTVAEVTEDGSPHGGRTVALWEPALLDDLVGENGAPVRRSAGAESARVMADLVAEGARTLTFVRSRRGAELTALAARARLEEVAPELAGRIASYRAGYLAEDRRALEHALSEGELRGVATTNALELGVDIAGLDAVVLAGFPGTVTSFWQQAGRAGRRRQSALIVLIARDDPLGHLPRAPPAGAAGPADREGGHRSGEPLRAGAAAAVRGDRTAVDRRRGAGLGRRGGGRRTRRRRPAAPPVRGLVPGAGVDPHPAVDIRGSSGGQIAILEAGTGACWAPSAADRRRPRCIRRGVSAPGREFVVDSLDFEDGIALVHEQDPGYSTAAREVTDIAVTGPGERRELGPVTIGVVPVSVSNTVTGYLRRRLDGEASTSSSWTCRPGPWTPSR
jgi:DEAD/DEAH box helicase domain-containing protein